MNCKNCGNPLDPESKVCPNCGVEVSAEENFDVAENEVTENIYEEAVPITGPGNGGDYAEPPKPEKPGLSKKMKITLISVVAVLVLLVGAAAAYFAIFSGDEKDDKFVPGGKIDTFAEDVSTAIDALKSSGGGLEGTVELDMKVTLGKEGKELLMNALRGNADETVLSILSSINSVGLDTEITFVEGKMAVDAALKANDKPVVEKASLVIDINEACGYLTAPGLTEKALRIDMSPAKRDLQEMVASMNEAQKMYDIIPEKQETKAFVVKFASLVCEAMGEVAEEKGTLEVNGVSNEYSFYSVEVTEEMALDVCKKVLNEIKTDATAKEVIEAFGEYAHQPNLYAQFTKEVDEMLDDLAKENAKSDETMKLKLWFNEKNEITGLNMAVQAVELDWRSVSNGGKCETIIMLKDNGREEFILEMSGTESGDKYSGSASVKAEGKDIAEFGFKDVDMKKLDEGSFVGELSIKPAAEFTRTMPAEFREVNVTLSSADDESFALSLYNADKFYGSVEFKVVEKEAKSLSIPDSYEENPEEWLKSLNLIKLVGNISSAGISIPMNF